MNDDYLAVLTILVSVGAIYLAQRPIRRRGKRFWMRYWLLRRDTLGKGLLNEVENELRIEDFGYYRNFLRMRDEDFDIVLNLIADDILKEDTIMRPAIDVKKRLAVTLRYLATGESFESLGISCRMASVTVSGIVKETLSAIVTRMGPIYLQDPASFSTADWEKISDDFLENWGIPNCLGAIDGKHIGFRPGTGQGAFYYNYKGFNSIVLLAVVDANRKFTLVDIGMNGRVSDGGVFLRSRFYEYLVRNMFNLPEAKPLPGRILKMPFFFIADSAFPLMMRLMKPYLIHQLSPLQYNYNYHLSRARIVVENAFGVLANRFRVFLSAIQSRNPDFVTLTVHASVILHNFLMERVPETYGNLTENDTVQLPPIELQNLRLVCGTQSRIELLRYFAQFMRQE